MSRESKKDQVEILLPHLKVCMTKILDVCHILLIKESRVGIFWLTHIKTSVRNVIRTKATNFTGASVLIAAHCESEIVLKKKKKN